MKRCETEPRPHWRAKVEQEGLIFHTDEDGVSYWAEDTYYEFNPVEISVIEKTTNDLSEMALQAAEHVLDKKRYAELGISPRLVRLIERSWDEDHFSLYGRLDLAFGPDGVPKLLEYNADTPTGLLEAAVIQWTWLKDKFTSKQDQFNSIHEKLIAKWKDVFEEGSLMHFAYVAENWEDEITTAYLQDTATQAGLVTNRMFMQEIGSTSGRNPHFVDLNLNEIQTLFKLYPWEWLVQEDADRINATNTILCEPAWKILLSGKGILPILWELFPNHPNLLPASFTPTTFPSGTVKKPMFGREGANVTIRHADGTEVSSDGVYGDNSVVAAGGKFVYQAYTPLAEPGATYHPVIGSWLVDQGAAGMGIREATTQITANLSRFVPHVIQPMSRFDLIE